ncbi:MAG TPA: hypothetical protein DCD99_11320 [Acinetobacter schindleri]|nr:hypothetical protein [Acinetobacter schindleri]
MTNFRKWFKGEYPGGHTSGYYFAHKAWQYRQQEIDQLKAQLNNMEACYIEKKKEKNELQKRVDAVKGLAQTLWEKSEEKHQQGKVWESKTLGECADEILDVLEQALKGDQ